MWTDTMDTQLKALWASGVPGSDIAEKIGVTRGAVASRRKRLKLPGRTRDAAALAANTKRLERAIAQRREFKMQGDVPGGAWGTGDGKPKEEVGEKGFLPLKGSNPLPWSLRAFGQCAWPVGGKGADTLSCCETVASLTLPYCIKHLERRSGRNSA